MVNESRIVVAGGELGEVHQHGQGCGSALVASGVARVDVFVADGGTGVTEQLLVCGFVAGRSSPNHTLIINHMWFML